MLKSIKDSLKGIKSMIVAYDEGGMTPYLLNGTGFVKLQIYNKTIEELVKY